MTSVFVVTVGKGAEAARILLSRAKKDDGAFIHGLAGGALELPAMRRLVIVGSLLSR